MHLPRPLPEKPTCNISADVAFVVDASLSINSFYIDEKYFVKAVATKLGLTENGVHGSVIAFSDKPVLKISFNDDQNLPSFIKAVNDIPLLGTETRIDKALRFGSKVMFDTRNGARRDASKVMVLVTDGSQPHALAAEDPAKIAEEIRKLGVHLIVVGIGGKVNTFKLYTIADEEWNVFSAGSFDHLVSAEFIQDVVKGACVPGNSYELF